ncbi:MAG: hypothetical protein OHK0031_01370 [Anaerolineales bacterium]
MKNRQNPSNVTQAETSRLARPATLLGLFLFAMLFFYGLWQHNYGMKNALMVSALGVAGISYTLFLYYLSAAHPAWIGRWQALILVSNAAAIAISLAALPAYIQIIPHLVIILVSVVTVIVWGRSQALIFIVSAATLQVVLAPPTLTALGLWAQFFSHLSLFLEAIILSEITHRLIQALYGRIERLENLNDFARRIGASLEKEEVISLVNSALQEALAADTYYLGILENGQIRLDLLYDDGEFFTGNVVNAEGTLSGWVVRNRQPLFIPDLRNDVELEGVSLVIAGKQQTSLSWMGIPMLTAHLTGILAVASYTPNAFDRTDMELLENLGQQAALALDNAYHYEEVEKQSRLDSLTQVYNHGYFLRLLEQKAAELRASGGQMSLVMMDIDYFKQYNDNYGHLVGDQVLVELTRLLRSYIKSTDSIGRWGGEEFALLLMNASGGQALQIASRIRERVNSLSLQTEAGRQIALPTVSQGVAVFPAETSDIIKLVDLADQRLYLAKERGRNQIEPGEEHWKYIQ